MKKILSFSPLTDEQLFAISSYAKEHGNDWKNDLLVDWMRASAAPILHGLRNSHGPTWLANLVIE